MRLLSMFFVSTDAERKFAMGRDAGADVLILDLEDSVAPSMMIAARAHLAKLVESPSKSPMRAGCRGASKLQIVFDLDWEEPEGGDPRNETLVLRM